MAPRRLYTFCFCFLNHILPVCFLPFRAHISLAHWLSLRLHIVFAAHNVCRLNRRRRRRLFSFSVTFMYFIHIAMTLCISTNAKMKTPIVNFAYTFSPSLSLVFFKAQLNDNNKRHDGKRFLCWNAILVRILCVAF